MPSAPSFASPFAHRPGCPLCGIVATPFPRSDSLDATTSYPAASSSTGRPLSGYATNPQAYAPWRRDSDSSSIQSGSGVGTAGGLPVNATSHSNTTNVIIHKDSNVTAYIEKKFPVSSKGHVIIVLKCVLFRVIFCLPPLLTCTSTLFLIYNLIASTYQASTPSYVPSLRTLHSLPIRSLT